MTLTQFKDCLDRLGARPESWPAPLNRQAADLLAADDQARIALDQARVLDQLLHAGDPAAQTGADSVLRVINSVMAQLPPRAAIPARTGLLGLLDRLGRALQTGAEWGPRLAAAASVALVLGIGAGFMIPAETQNARSAGAALAAASSYYSVNAQ